MDLNNAGFSLGGCEVCVAVQWATVSSPSELVSGCLLEHDEDVVRVKVVFQHETIQKSHQNRRYINKALFASQTSKLRKKRMMPSVKTHQSGRVLPKAAPRSSMPHTSSVATLAGLNEAERHA